MELLTNVRFFSAIAPKHKIFAKRTHISYTSDTGKTYDFNTADMLNTLLLNCLLSTGQLKDCLLYTSYNQMQEDKNIESGKVEIKVTLKEIESAKKALYEAKQELMLMATG